MQEIWQQNNLLIQAGQALKLQINHAFYGCIYTFNGSNRIGYNRLYFALDDCGHIRWNNGQKRLDLKANTITFMPPDIDLEFNFKPGKMVAIHFRIEVFPGFDVFSDEKQCLQIHHPKNAQGFYNKIKSLNSLPEIFSLQGDVLKNISDFCNRDLAYIKKQIALRKKYGELLNYIQIHLSGRLTIAEIAQHLCTTRDQISKSFNRDMGIPLKRLITNLLIQKISDELLNPNTLKEIAKNLQFNNEFYMSRFFKKQTGVSPSDFRRNNTEFKR